MEFTKNEAATLASSAAVGLQAEEIDLYEELISFAGMSPEEKRRLIASKQSEKRAVEPPQADPVSTTTANEPVEAEAPERAAEAVSAIEEPSEGGETSDPGNQLFDSSRTGALLAELDAVADFVFTGDLTRGACLACGSESGANDLFCVSCGVFIDNIGTPPAVNPSCGECGQGISADEIFCPWCGAAPTA